MLITALNSIERHLKEANTTYLKHMIYALKLSFSLGYASFALLVHSICPCLFQKTGSNAIRSMYKKLVDDNVIIQVRPLLRID